MCSKKRIRIFHSSCSDKHFNEFISTKGHFNKGLILNDTSQRQRRILLSSTEVKYDPWDQSEAFHIVYGDL